MSESGIGIAAAAHLAGAIKNVQYADLDSDILLEDKLVRKGGAPLKDSKRTFLSRPGLGIEEIDETLLGKPVRVYK
jgi:L-alanine-DL-glutamate epimerase-like enolase superfamily enzyme